MGMKYGIQVGAGFEGEGVVALPSDPAHLRDFALNTAGGHADAPHAAHAQHAADSQAHGHLVVWASVL